MINRIPTDSVRRHADGSIDFDFYRATMIALRRQAMRDTHVLRTAAVGAVMTVAAMSFVAAILAMPTFSHHATATVVSTPLAR